MRDEKERLFLSMVRVFKDIGYGRMVQIISHEWYRHDRYGAALANTAYGLLNADDRATYEALAKNDPLFKED